MALLGHEKAALEAVAASLPGPTPTIEVDVTTRHRWLPRHASGPAGTLPPRYGRASGPSAVVNVGIAEGGPFLASDPAAWRRVLDVNLTGSAHMARACLPDLFDTAGYFLQIAPLASIGAVPGISAYFASKAAAEAFAHSLRAWWRTAGSAWASPISTGRTRT